MKTTKSCPKCHETLSIDARACECGWRLRTAPKEPDAPVFIHCAHEDCATSAIVRIQTPTGWAKLCEAHYVAHFQAQADKKFADMGLTRWANESRADWRARVSEYTKLIIKRMPDQDESEKDAA